MMCVIGFNRSFFGEVERYHLKLPTFFSHEESGALALSRAIFAARDRVLTGPAIARALRGVLSGYICPCSSHPTPTRRIP